MGPARTLLALFLFFGMTGCGTIPKIVILNDPLSGREHLQLGFSYEARGEWDLAIAEYQRAIEKGEAPSVIQGYLGNVYYGKKDYTAAEQAYKKSLHLHPQNAPVLNNLASLYLVEGRDLLEAERLVQQAIEIDPARKSYYLDTLAAIYLARADYEPALAAYREAEAFAPSDLFLLKQLSERQDHVLELLEEKTSNRVSPR
ncbi:MAG: tetratricopeptide repeat protein [Candidatus Manganitrophus sp.]|nr:tetratricopeptide repeat protein [Candidatus Manganitrophus sp.]